MNTVKKFLSLVKFSHTIFAMPFAMIGFFLGLKDRVGGWNLHEVQLNSGWLIWKELMIRFVLVLLCMVFARNAAMAFNRWLDSTFDALNPRTAIREIPSGIISKDSALRFVIFNCLAFIVCAAFINIICLLLSPVALFVVLFYSYTKRFTPLCHLVLGIGLSLAPIGAYLAVTGSFALLPLLFSLTVVFWVSGFDIIYALQDEEFDRSQNLYSIPSWLGKSRALRVSEFLHLITFAIVVYAGIYADFGWLYWFGVLIFTGMLLYQHSIVKPDDLSRVNLAFMTANGIASVLFGIFVITDMLVNNQ